MPTKCLRPAVGRLIFNPLTGRPLSRDGEVVELTPFWRRVLRRGDAVAVPDSVVSAPVAVESKELEVDPQDLPLDIDTQAPQATPDETLELSTLTASSLDGEEDDDGIF